jgi:hypothetical protein
MAAEFCRRAPIVLVNRAKQKDTGFNFCNSEFVPYLGSKLTPAKSQSRNAMTDFFTLALSRAEDISVSNPSMNDSSGMLRRVAWYKLADVAEVLTAFIMRVIALTKEAKSTSETSVNFYQTTRRNLPEGNHLDTRRRKNLKPHLEKY